MTLRRVCRALLLAGLLAAAVAQPAAAADPACFGAAARDAANPCSNPTPTVVPALDDENTGPSARCRPVRGAQPAPICTFGAAARRARGQIALVGDSHALHWRTALDVAARANRWRGFSITAPGCLFSDANRALHEGIRAACAGWERRVLRWLKAHPRVSTVFISQNVATPVVAPPGRTVAAVKVAGYQRTWKALPRSVRRVFVIRDTPLTSETTLACLRRVVAAGDEAPGPACPEGRAYAIRQDTAVTAARALRARRYRVVDLTDFFCDARACFPVIGGVRVYADTLGHLTETYSRTLGPYLLRAVRRLMRSR